MPNIEHTHTYWELEMPESPAPFEPARPRVRATPRSIGHRKSRLARIGDWLNRHDLTLYIVCLTLGGACLYFAVALGVKYLGN